MKKLSLLVVWCFILMMTSCQEDISVDTPVPDFGSFKGLKVPIPQGVPSEVMNYKEADFQSFFYKKLSKARASADFQITLEQFIQYSQPVVDKYPNRSNLRSDDSMIKKVQQDFKHLSDKEIDQQLDNILAYYNQLVTYELMNVLPNVPATSKSGRLASGYFGTGLNSCEFWLIAQNSGKQGAVQWATENALNWANEDFPGTTFQGKGDAFRHSLWTALIVQKLSDEGYATYEAHGFAHAFTEAHECNTTDDFDKNMDLHNNQVGFLTYPTLTSYTYHWTGCGFLCWGRIPIFNNPGYDNLRQYYKNLANGAVQVYNVTDIQNTSATTLVRIQ